VLYSDSVSTSQASPPARGLETPTTVQNTCPAAMRALGAVIFGKMMQAPSILPPKLLIEGSLEKQSGGPTNGARYVPALGMDVRSMSGNHSRSASAFEDPPRLVHGEERTEVIGIQLRGHLCHRVGRPRPCHGRRSTAVARADKVVVWGVTSEREACDFLFGR